MLKLFCNASLALDGTGYFSSEKLSSESCMVKVSKKSGKESYYMQALGACIVHPDRKEVIPLCPEMIQKQDGDNKNDCERNGTGSVVWDIIRLPQLGS